MKRGTIMNSRGYIYDGSFEGLFTCIYEAYYRHETPDIITEDKKYKLNVENTLFSLLDKENVCQAPIYIETDLNKYIRVYNAVLNKISPDAMETIYHVFLSELPGAETMILDYIKLGFKIGFDINKHLQDKRVLNMIKTERKVVFETYRMIGFIRFEKKHDFYYAAYEPDHNITSIITPHFAERLSDQNFIIHDIKRKVASVYNKRSWYITSLNQDNMDSLINKEDNNSYEELWKNYFISASIQERENLKNQKRQMPKRYWKHLPEI
jgi:probable DNA metabolism protein